MEASAQPGACSEWPFRGHRGHPCPDGEAWSPVWARSGLRKPVEDVRMGKQKAQPGVPPVRRGGPPLPGPL